MQSVLWVIMQVKRKRVWKTGFFLCLALFRNGTRHGHSY